MSAVRLYLLAAMLCGAGLAPVSAHAQCMLRVLASGSSATTLATASSPVGQSFVACQSGIITDVYIEVGAATELPIRLGLQPGTTFDAGGFGQWMSFPTNIRRYRFQVAYPVIAGDVYSFSITPQAGQVMIGGVDDSLYPDGSMIQVIGGVSVARPFDTKFTILFAPDPVVPALPARWGTLKAAYR